MEEYKGGYNKTMLFHVYKTLDGLYAEEKICNIYNVGCKNDRKIINGKNVVKCSKEEIDSIEEQSYNQLIRLVPNYISSYELQLEINFIVYVDKKHNDSLYIKNDLCEKYNINPISKRTINAITYCNITEKDLNIIELKSQYENPILKRKYVNIEFSNIKKPANTLFIYYHNLTTNKLYINRETLEKTRNYNIEIEGYPEIIDNKNCYTITANQMKEYEEKSSAHGIERIVLTNYSNKKRDINDKYEIILIYKDCNTNKLYIDKDKATRGFSNNTKIILNKECYETSIIELENKNNKKYIIVDVYTKNEIEEYSFIVCNCNDEIFIPQQVMEKFNIESEYLKKIRVNHEIYEKIAKEKLDDLLNKNIFIKPVYKKIVPMKR